MSSQAKETKGAASQRTILDDIMLTFTSPMAWLLVVALIITWLGVAIVLFDLLDYKTLAGVRSSPAIAKRGLKTRGGVRPMKSSSAGVTAQESVDWLEMIWTFAAGLVAPEDEEEGIHQLNETFTSFHTEEL
ncbi:triadin-like isoform 3-T4 [Pholidichthys leucotaenia]